MKSSIVLHAISFAVFITVSSFASDQKPAASKAKTSEHAAAHYRNVDPGAFDQLRRSDTNTVVLDVRTKKEYREGHIPGAVLLDFNSPEFDEQVAKLDKSKTYLVHCAGGGRSAKACKKMETMDFSKLYNLQGGMGAWKKAGKPVEK
jgi:rhodanese-related sulfurtransferase